MNAPTKEERPNVVYRMDIGKAARNTSHSPPHIAISHKQLATVDPSGSNLGTVLF